MRIQKLAIHLLFYSLGSLPVWGNAQEILTLEKAIEEALAKNYTIKIAKNNAKMSKNSVSRGNAGLLPKVTANAGLNYSKQNTKNVFVSGEEQSVNGATTWRTNADITATYTIFNGWANLHTYQNLQLQAAQSEVQLAQDIETILFQVSNVYYTVVRLQQNYLLAQENAKISAERLLRASNKNEYGVANKLAVLNAEVDLNTDSVAIITSKLEVENAKRDLNVLLGKELNTRFTADTSIQYSSNLTLEELKPLTTQENTTLKNARHNKMRAEINLKDIKLSKLPRLDASTSYGYSRQRSDAGFLLTNRNVGFSAGLTLRFDIFDGNRKNIQAQNAQIDLENTQETYRQISQQINRDLENAYANLQNRFQVLRVEERSVQTAQANFERTRELFNFGQVTTTQFREAQLNLINAKNSLNIAKIDTKLSEIELFRLSGKLLTKN